MTSRERMMTALRGGIPDRVPCAPDISCMIPCRITGKPFYDSLLYNNPPVWKSYLKALDYFGFDGWFLYGMVNAKHQNGITGYKSEITTDTKGRKVLSEVFNTPKGDLTQTILFPEYDSETRFEKLIKNFKEDFPKFKYLYPELKGYDNTLYKQQKKELGERGIFVMTVSIPGLQIFSSFFEGSLEAATYAYYDEPDLFAELVEHYKKNQIQYLEMVLEQKPDSVLLSASGAMTMQSPELWRELTLPTVKEMTRMCKQAGVISGMHSCGKQRYMVEVCANETDLDYINPLEEPPMGDCNLGEIKKTFGSKISLMGNLHTTKVMYLGGERDVKKAALRVIKDAGVGGGFVLSSGDQCGRDTPDKNIFAMLEICREYGQYPIDLGKIDSGLKLL